MNEKLFTNREIKILIELICNEQTHYWLKRGESYKHDKYKELEALKVKIKELE